VQFHGNPLPVLTDDTFVIQLNENLISTSINAYPRRN